MKKWAMTIGALFVGLILGLPLYATAQPPVNGLCADLTGDALTKCLYSELDDRLRANDMPPATPSPSPSASQTQTPTPTPTPEFQAAIGEITSTTLEVTWPAWPNATGYNVGRDGRDSTCTAACPWSTDDPATARSRIFDKLLPGTEYTLTVKVLPNGPTSIVKAFTKAAASPSPSVTPTPSATPTPTPTPTQPPAAGTWLSGAAGPENATGSFGTWRGSESEIAGTWVNSTDIWSVQPGFELGNWSKPIDLAANVPDWQGWQAEANGVHDGYWRAFAQNLKKYRGGKGTTYVRIYHEYNGDWYPWTVTAADQANFKTAWTRTANIIKTEFPQAKMMLGSAAAGGNGRINVADAWPTGVDVLSIDWYNEWGHCTTDACFQDKIENGAGANSLADLTRLAKAKGVPVMISEWGNAGQVRPASGGGGGEAPAVMQSMHTWLKANAGTGPGQVVGEVYFNIGGYDARFELFLNGSTANGVQPVTAAKYKELWKTN